MEIQNLQCSCTVFIVEWPVLFGVCSRKPSVGNWGFDGKGSDSLPFGSAGGRNDSSYVFIRILVSVTVNAPDCIGAGFIWDFKEGMERTGIFVGASDFSMDKTGFASYQ